MTRGPYLQHAEDGVVVAWYTGAPGEGRVRFFSDAGATGEAVAPAGTTRREATLRGLVPGLRYSYRVFSPLGPLASTSGEVEFSFRAPDSGVLRFVAFGDCGSGTADQYAVAQALRSESLLPDLVMIVGDVVYSPFDATSYDTKFFAPYGALLPQVPFYALLGNHDYEFEGGRPFFEVFSLPRNGPAGLAPESSYWLERAGVQMIVHDTNQAAATLRQQSIPWQAALARRPATFRLVFQHHPMYSSGPNFPEIPSPQLRELLGPVYSSSGIDVVFNGHDHLYERTRPIDGVVYVTTGVGGAALYPRAATNSFTAAFANDRHGYSYVEVSGRTLWLRQMDTAGVRYDALELTKPVTAADPLLSFAGAGAPPRGWSAPGYDDAGWREAARGAGRLLARRGFDVARPAAVSEAVLRVSGVSDYRVRLNDVEVARGGLTGDALESFTIPGALLREGRNALAIEGFSAGPDAARPSLELALVSPAPRQPAAAPIQPATSRSTRSAITRARSSLEDSAITLITGSVLDARRMNQPSSSRTFTPSRRSSGLPAHASRARRRTIGTCSDGQ
jgi:3',5'-cyclic AMP phosphodiesterase CpdA